MSLSRQELKIVRKSVREYPQGVDCKRWGYGPMLKLHSKPGDFSIGTLRAWG